MSDSTELQDAATRIAELEAELAEARVALDALHQASDGIWDWRIRTGEDRLSERWKRSLGYEPHEIDDTVEAWKELLHPDDFEEAWAAVEAHLERGEPYEIIARYRRRDGSTAWMLARGQAYRGADGEWERMVGTHTDVTRLVEAEAELREANRRIEARVQQRTEELRRTVASLERRNGDLRRFAHIAAHDLAEPARITSSFVELVMEDWADELPTEAAEHLALVRRAAQRMVELVRDLRKYAEVDRYLEGREDAACDSAQVLDEVLEDLAESAKEADAVVERGVLPLVGTSAVELRRVFANLLSNSFRYRGDAPARVHVTAQREGEFWSFRVRDHGVGLDEAQAQQAFDLFRRLGSSQGTEGTGLGLSIVKRIVEGRGGGVRIGPAADGSGAEVVFELPGPPSG